MITLHTLKDYSLHEILAQARTHLLAQNKKSIIDDVCQYRIETPTEVLQCAVGCFISADMYESGFEGNSALYVLQMLDIKTSIENNFLLKRLQYIHDTRPVDWWERFLDATASDIGSKTSIAFDAIENEYLRWLWSRE